MTHGGYEKRVLEDGVVVCTVASSDHEAMEAWFNDVGEVLTQAREQGKPARLMYDVRNLGLLSAYKVQRFDAMEKRVEDQEQRQLPSDWRVATVVGNPFIANLVNYFISVSVLPEMRHRSRVFANEMEALAWLRGP